MNCQTCGTFVPEGHRFCPGCGNEMRAVPPPIPQNFQPQPQPPYQIYVPPPAPPVLQPGRLPRPAAITIYSLIHFFYALLFVAAAGIVARLAFLGENHDTKTGLLIIAGVCGFLVLVMLAAAVGLWLMRPFGRILLICFASIGLLGFPFYTVLSVVLLIYLFRLEIKLLFSGKKSEELTSSELNSLATLPQAQVFGLIAAIGSAVVTGASLVIMAVMAGGLLIPGVLGQPTSGKDKATMADMRSIGTAVESYAVDENAYPEATSMEDLAKILEPTYIKTLPRLDRWGYTFHYRAFDPNDDGPQKYTIVSSGSDGILEHSDLQGYPEGTIKDLNEDLVFSMGSFTRYPEWTQK